jgi:hypothetical protein
VSDGVTFKGVKTPGVSFIGFADSVPQAVDLRTQLRAFFVEARTKDGIGVKVLAFAPFHIDCGIDIPRLGQPFPFRAQAAFKALHKAQLIEHTDKGQVPERMEAHLWDDLPRVIGTRVLRDIIAKYRFDDLCAPYKLADDPRDEIVKEFKNQLGNELQSCGIGQRSRLRQIEKARAQAQVEVVQTLSDRLIRLQETETIISSEEIVKMFIDMINQVALRPLVRRLLPDGLTDSVQQMGQRVEGYNHESGTGR